MEDEELDWNDGYLDAEMGGVPRTTLGSYYEGFMAYQDELSDRKNEIEDEIDDLKNDIMSDIDAGDYDSARDKMDELDELDDEIDDIDSEMY